MEASIPQEEESKALLAAAVGRNGEEAKDSPVAVDSLETESMAAMTVISGADAGAAVAAEVEFAACDCCGLTEECTPAYIAGVRERYGGRWICGLCAEAVQDEIRRSGLLISTEEAMSRHANFCRSFRVAEAAAADAAEQFIVAVRQLVRRSFDSPRAVRSMPSSPRLNVGIGSRSRLGRAVSGGFAAPTLLGSDG